MSSLPVPVSLDSTLRHLGSADPRRPFLIDAREPERPLEYTWGDADRQVDALAEQIAAHACRSVGVLLDNSYRNLCLIYAVMRAGKHLVLIDPEWGEAAKQAIVDEMRLEALASEHPLEGALAGLRLALEQDPDLILLDLMLPEMDGFEVCRRLRGEGRATPVIMLTAREEETDKVLGLELGADDYITKPFSMRELLARVKANIRRSAMAPVQGEQAQPASGNRLELGRVVVDQEKATVYKDGNPLELTQREYDLICYLASQPGKVFSREALMEHVWNYEGYVGDVRAVDVAVRRLREKIEDDPASPKFIVTKRGMGYLFGGE